MNYYPDHYETVAAGQTGQVLGATGGKGDILDTLIISVATAASGTVSIGDGAAPNIVITAANTPIGVYVVRLKAKSKVGDWRVTTGAGATVVAIGTFS